MSQKFRYLFFMTLPLLFNLNYGLLRAQSDFVTKTFTTADGLVNNSVTTICQDKTGYLWIGTWYGVSRFDGYEFKNYYFDVVDSLSLPYFSIDKIVTDNKNNLYVFCNNHPVSVYNRNIDRFRSIPVDGLNDDAKYSDVETDTQDRIWVVADFKIYRSADNGKHYTPVTVIDEYDKPLETENSPFITFDNLGTAWIYYVNGSDLIFYQSVLLNDTTLKVNRDEYVRAEKFCQNSFRRNGMIRIYRSPSGATWLLSDRGRYTVNQEDHQFTRVNSSSDCSGFIGSSPFIWIENETGINFYDPQKSEHKIIRSDFSDPYLCAYASSDGILWAAKESTETSANGLIRFIRRPGYFKHYLTGKNKSGEQELVFPLLRDKKGDLWAGTRKSEFLYRIKPDGSVVKKQYLPFYKGNEFPRVRSMMEDENGIWLGCTENHLIFYDSKTHKFKTCLNSMYNFQFRQTTLGIHNITDAGDYIMINGFLGLYLYNKKTANLRLVYLRNPPGKVFSLEKGKNGRYWLGTHAGMVVWFDSNTFMHQEYHFGENESLVTDIVEGDHNDLWVAMQGSGLGHLNYLYDLFEIFSTNNGLANKNVYSVLKDKNGRLWLSTENGISCFNPATLHFRNYSSADGLLIKEFDDDSNFMAEDGTMYFGGVGGIVSFNPEKMDEKSNFNYPLIISSLSVSGKQVPTGKAVYELGSVKLKKGEDNILASIACLNLADGNNLKYRYRLRGLTTKWLETDQRNRNIMYFNLKPGHYLLEAEAVGTNANWISETSLKIEIPPLVTQTMGFKIILLLLFLSMLAGLTQLYIRHIRLVAKHESEELRLEALRARMNPHFIFNSLNSISYYISNNDKNTANHYISDFSRLMRSFLDNLSGDFSPLDSEIDMINDYLDLEKLRFHDKFTFSVTWSETIDIYTYCLFPGIVQPFVENAVIHGISGLNDNKGHISVHFESVNDSVIKCLIADDGIGRLLSGKKKNSLFERKSRGTEIVTERLRLYNQRRKASYTLVIEDLYPDREETGTRVIIEIPAMKY